jgi:hypothetical protein
LLPAMAKRLFSNRTAAGTADHDSWKRFQGATMVAIDGVDFQPYLDLLLTPVGEATLPSLCPRTTCCLPWLRRAPCVAGSGTATTFPRIFAPNCWRPKSGQSLSELSDDRITNDSCLRPRQRLLKVRCPTMRYALCGW